MALEWYEWECPHCRRTTKGVATSRANLFKTSAAYGMSQVFYRMAERGCVMCDYCKPCGTAIDDDYPVFEDMFDCYPVECCAVMCYTSNHEVYLVRHAVDWYLAIVNGYDGTGSTVSVSACPICGRNLRGDAE